jgi:predicted amidohydrolase YtcJ
MAARLTALLVVAIVAVTVVAGLIVGAQRDDENGPVTLIVYNGRVFAADGAGTFAEAVAIRGNRILRVGTNREIKRLRRPQTTVIDAHGGAVLPGFNDAHIGSSVLAFDHVNLLGASTLEQVQTRIASFASEHPDRPWVLGRGWSSQSFHGGQSARQILDAVVPDRPAQMTAEDGHAIWVNSRALELAGVTHGTPNPENGVIVRDPRSGEPTGVLKDAAVDIVARLVPRATPDERRRAVQAATIEAQRSGVTSVQHAHGGAGDLEVYDELRRSGDLTVRVYAAVPVTADLDEAQADQIDDLLKRFPDDPLIKAGAAQVVVESHPETRRAAAHGAAASAISTPDELNRVVALVDRRGWQVVAHASDERAVRMTLDALEHAARTNPQPARGRRHRIEHVDAVDPADGPRFAALGIIASVQPSGRLPGRDRPAAWSGPAESGRAPMPWLLASLHESGGRLVLGSDWPAGPFDPRLTLIRIVAGTQAEDGAGGIRLQDQGLALTSAIEAYTAGAAYASFDDHRKGTLTPGMLADLVILSSDIFTQPPSRLLDARVDVTIFDGRVVYERPNEAGDTSS